MAATAKFSLRNEGPNAEVIDFREEKLRRIRASAKRVGVAASFAAAEEVAALDAMLNFPLRDLFLPDRPVAVRSYTSERVVAAPAAAIETAKCLCGSDSFWHCDGKLDDGPLFRAEPDGKRKTRVCSVSVCAACVIRVGKEGFCKACGPAAHAKTEADAVDLDEIVVVLENEPPVGPPDVDDDGQPDDGITTDAADATILEDF